MGLNAFDDELDAMMDEPSSTLFVRLAESLQELDFNDSAVKERVIARLSAYEGETGEPSGAWHRAVVLATSLMAPFS